jgi:hypothetical protein
MTQDGIIEMARQAGFSGSVAKMWIEHFEAFAKLVDAKATAKEREALVLLLRNLADDHTPNDCADMICALQSLGAIRARAQADRGEA